ncbi:hypothetical protein IV203_031539 [Nitzschia inconspicua]|uniref:Uncharacterized protein n=1 Tax=Nitzschia inconspicua TaxID=303405 RepID=A0A9K3LX96_9STRA|nr:hypothetical protein IV203_031539 [Nitzschia inconspicua]
MGAPRGGREVDPLLVKDQRTANIMMVKGPNSSSSLNDRRRRFFCCRCPEGRSAITTTALVAVIIFSAALVYLFVVMEEKGDFDVGPIIIDESVLPDDKDQVEVSPKGVYSVRYVPRNESPLNSSNSNVLNNQTTATTLGHPFDKNFADLALMMLPPWYTASRMAMNDVLLADKMDPSNVKNARQVLLTTRDLLDVFSPVYPTRSLWGSVRSLYKDGYELVGYYQDLDHAHVAFSPKLWEQRKKDVLKWKYNFESFDSHHDIHTFLSKNVDTEGCYDHSESHLFWGELDGYLPCGSDMATASLQKLVAVQLNNAMDLLDPILNLDTVLRVEDQELFHDFRKEVRSVLDEWDLFGTVLFPTANRSGSPVHSSLKTLKSAHQRLGKINDNWTAYHLYLIRHEHKDERKRLAIQINTAWDDFKDWVTTTNLPGAIQSLLDEIAS